MDISISKPTRLILISILLFFIYSIQVVGAEWISTNTIPDGARPYQNLSIMISNSAGTNNATHIFCNGNCNSNFSDVYFTQGGNNLSYYMDPTINGKFWVNVTGNGTVLTRYGTNTATTSSNGTLTFDFFEDFSGDLSKWNYDSANIVSGKAQVTGTYFASKISFSRPHILEMEVQATSAPADNMHIGFTSINNGLMGGSDSGVIYHTGLTPTFFTAYYNGASRTWETIGSSDASMHNYTIEWASDGTSTRFLDNGILRTSPASNFPVATGFYIGLNKVSSGSMTQRNLDNIRVMRYASPTPQWSTWSPAYNTLITSWGNNFTNDNSTSISLTENKVVNFNITAPATSYSWTVNSIDQSTNASNFTYNFNTVGIFVIKATAVNATETSTITWTVSLPLSLTSPTNASTIFYNYPPIQTAITHTWGSAGYPYYNVRISTDPNFNFLVVDSYTSLTSYTTSLSAGKYYWKVRDYNTDTMTGTWSGTSEYTVTSNTSAAGVGIQGVVYEMVGGVQTPISGATVYIYNNTFSSSVITGTNGYYIFTGLTNSTTYSIYASKQGYETTAIFPVTTGTGNVQTKDILMKIYISPYVPNFVFEKFIVRGLFDNPFPGVLVNVYKDSDITPSYTGYTDSMGQVVFQLIKDQYYRVTFSGGGLSNTITRYIYGKEESYLLTVVSGFPTGGNRSADISVNLTSTTFNATYNNLSLIYLDNKNSTSIINFYAINISTGESCFKNSTSQSTTISCTVLASGIYRFGFNATSSIYGTFSEDRVINFAAGNTAAPLIPTKTSATLMHWASVMLIVLTASLFSVRNIRFGAIIVPGMALVVWVVGWLQAPFLLLSIAMALGVMIYMRSSEIKVNY